MSYRATQGDDTFLVETVRFIHSEMVGKRSDSRVNDNPWGLDESSRADLHLLLATLKEYAGYQLLDCPVFKPFGVSLDNAGKPGIAVAQLEGRPELGAYRQALLLSFQGQVDRGEIRATGFAEDGRAELAGTSGEADVVLIRMEHRSGVAFSVGNHRATIARNTMRPGAGRRMDARAGVVLRQGTHEGAACQDQVRQRQGRLRHRPGPR